MNREPLTVNHQPFLRTTNNEQLFTINHQLFNGKPLTRIRLICTDFIRDYLWHPCHPCSICLLSSRKNQYAIFKFLYI